MQVKLNINNSIVSSKQTNFNVKRMYKKHNVSHLRTEITILSPIKDDDLQKFKEMSFNQKLGEVLEKFNQDIEELIGEYLEVDIESVYTSARNLVK